MAIAVRMKSTTASVAMKGGDTGQPCERHQNSAGLIRRVTGYADQFLA
jgi:hypothetical protein